MWDAYGGKGENFTFARLTRFQTSLVNVSLMVAVIKSFKSMSPVTGVYVPDKNGKANII